MRLTNKLSIREQLCLAKSIAMKAHLAQYRKGQYLSTGKPMPYIVHPARIVKALREKYPIDPSYQIVAWLHDVLEDTSVTREDLLKAGIGEEYVVMVEALTRKDGETYFDFIMRMGCSHMPRRIKIADVEDNLGDNLKEGSLKDKYRLALYVLYEFEKYWENIGKKNKKGV